MASEAIDPGGAPDDLVPPMKRSKTAKQTGLSALAARPTARPGRHLPIRVFYSYSHKDEKLRDQLQDHLSLLRRQGVISGWHDRRVGAGDEWRGAIDKNLEESDIVLLLVSPSFLSSDYCYDAEIMRAIERKRSR